MSDIEKIKAQEYARIRKLTPDEESVRALHKQADAKYREAVREGDGSPASGIIIARHFALREALRRYAEENGIELEEE